MFLSPLNYSRFNGYSFLSFMLSPACSQACPVLNWLAFGQLPENPVVTPSSSVQVVYPSAKNKFLQSVTVEAVTTPTP